MFSRTYLLFTLVGLLLFAACTSRPAPATDTMNDSSIEQSEDAMSDDEMADDEMSDDEMSDDEMADDAMMDAGESMTDTMMHEGEMMTDTHAITDTMSGDAMSGEMPDSEMLDASETMTDTTMAEDAMAMNLPAWQTMALTDARTGERFTLADFSGKTVFVETMATWCTNCRQQLGNVKSAVARADGEQVVFIAISVETDLAAETLAQYAENNDFGWTFAVATPEMVRALADTFGPTIANPPATPHFWIAPDLLHGDLVTGYESGDVLLEQLAG